MTLQMNWVLPRFACVQSEINSRLLPNALAAP